MRNVDLRKEYRQLYAPRAGIIERIEVPRLSYAMVDGAIEKGRAPGDSPSFEAATQALYGLSFTLKFMIKKRPVDPVDYPVMALEGLWWVDDGFFDLAVKDNWKFSLMILLPDFVDGSLFAEGLDELRKKKGGGEALELLRLGSHEEGACVQALHVGPYATEPATVALMRAYMASEGLRDLVGEGGGKHHEVYLGDPRRSDPAKLKTILRHPVASA